MSLAVTGYPGLAMNCGMKHFPENPVFLVGITRRRTDSPMIVSNDSIMVRSGISTYRF
jgi:hypothetical protein